MRSGKDPKGSMCDHGNNGSNRSLRSFRSGKSNHNRNEIDTTSNTTPTRRPETLPLQQQQGRNNDDIIRSQQLPSQLRYSRELKLMEHEIEDVNEKLNEKKYVTEDLRKQNLNQQRRIEELEAQNEKLRSKLLSLSRRNMGRGGYDKSSSNDDGLNNGGSSHSQRSYSRQNSRINNSGFRAVHTNGEQRRDVYHRDYDEKGWDNHYNNSTGNQSNNRRLLTKSAPPLKSSPRSKSRQWLSRHADRQASTKRRSAESFSKSRGTDLRSSSCRSLNVSRSMEQHQQGSSTNPKLSRSYQNGGRLSRSLHGRTEQDY